MVDLKTQYQKIKSEIDLAWESILENTAFVNGPAVKSFASNLGNFLHANHVIPCANGTDALQIALMGLELEPGDEVITTPFSFIATVEVIALLRLKPVFVDIDPETFNMDVAQLESVITDRTRAIIPVHLFGQCADLAAIERICRPKGIGIIEDNAQAIGAKSLDQQGDWKFAGTIGDIGCTSFYPSKNLGCFGDGGALYCQDEAIGKRLQILANHGASKKYYHDRIGVNSRLDSLQAAVLDVKLKYLNEYISARQEAAAIYDAGLASRAEVKIPKRVDYSTHVFHQYTLIVPEGRDELKAYLSEQGIPSMIYYPVPLHVQPAFFEVGGAKVEMPVAERLSKQVLSLPMHTELDQESQGYIIEKINRFFN